MDFIIIFQIQQFMGNILQRHCFQSFEFWIIVETRNKANKTIAQAANTVQHIIQPAVCFCGFIAAKPMVNQNIKTAAAGMLETIFYNQNLTCLLRLCKH